MTAKASSRILKRLSETATDYAWGPICCSCEAQHVDIDTRWFLLSLLLLMMMMMMGDMVMVTMTLTKCAVGVVVGVGLVVLVLVVVLPMSVPTFQKLLQCTPVNRCQHDEYTAQPHQAGSCKTIPATMPQQDQPATSSN